MKKQVFGLLAVALLLSSPLDALAATGYISDELYVPLRAGKGNQYKILHRGLRSGTALEILKEEDGDWLLVKTRNGTEGWIRAQYISREPTAALKLDQLTQRLANTNDQYADTRVALQELQDNNTRLQTELEETRQQLTAVNEEFGQLKKISGDAVALHGRHQDLMQKYEVLQTELDIKISENERLRKDDSRRWFMYGAGAVGLGVLLTLIIPLLRPKKKYSEWAN